MLRKLILRLRLLLAARAQEAAVFQKSKPIAVALDHGVYVLPAHFPAAQLHVQAQRRAVDYIGVHILTLSCYRLYGSKRRFKIPAACVLRIL